MKKILKALLFPSLFGLLGSCCLNAKPQEDVFEKQEFQVRTIDYSEKLNNDLFEGFDNPTIEVHDEEICIKASRTIDLSRFDKFDLISFSPFGNNGFGKIDTGDIDFRADIKKTRVTTFTASFNNFMINIGGSYGSTNVTSIKMIDGFATYNNAGDMDILFADKNSTVWLSEIGETDLNNIGFWDWICDIVDAVTETIEEVVDKVVEVATSILEDVIEFAEDVLAFLGTVVASSVLTVAKALSPCQKQVFRGAIAFISEVFTLEETAKIFCAYPDGDGVYHINQNCWQMIGGYNDIYDQIFHEMCDKPKPKKFPFYDVDGDDLEDYVLWAWKGEYWSFGTGCELAIYRRLNDSEWWYVDASLAMDMSCTVYYDGWVSPKDGSNILVDDWKDDEQNWWLTAWNPAIYRGDSDKISVEYKIKFNSHTCDDELNDKLAYRFLKENEEKGWKKIGENEFYYYWEETK